MAEGKITFAAQPTPSWDDFKTVTITAGISQVGGQGSVLLHKELDPPAARAYAAEIVRACEIVEAEIRG